MRTRPGRLAACSGTHWSRSDNRYTRHQQSSCLLSQSTCLAFCAKSQLQSLAVLFNYIQSFIRMSNFFQLNAILYYNDKHGTMGKTA